MTIEQLRQMRWAEPFQPFDIRLADGRSLPVNQPEFLCLTPAGRTFAVGVPDGTIVIVDLSLVTSLEPRPPASKRRGRQRGQSAQ